MTVRLTTSLGLLALIAVNVTCAAVFSEARLLNGGGAAFAGWALWHHAREA